METKCELVKGSRDRDHTRENMTDDRNRLSDRSRLNDPSAKIKRSRAVGLHK